RAGMTGRERLERGVRLPRRTDLADDDAVRPHAQRVLDELGDAHAGMALALRDAFEVDRVRVREEELARVLHDDDALIGRHELGEGTEERALPAAGRSGDEEVQPRRDARREERGAVLAERAARDPAVGATERDRLAAHLAD